MPVGSEWWGAQITKQDNGSYSLESRQCLSAVSGGVPAVVDAEISDFVGRGSPMPVGSEWWGAQMMETLSSSGNRSPMPVGSEWWGAFIKLENTR